MKIVLKNLFDWFWQTLCGYTGEGHSFATQINQSSECFYCGKKRVKNAKN